MNPERLAELQRQRDLVREQLVWLDREIETCRAGSPDPAVLRSPDPAVPSAAVAAASTRSFDPTPAAASAYQPDPASAAAGMKRGCLLGVAFVFLVGFLLLAAIYFLRYRDRSLFTLEKSPPAEKTSPPPVKSPPPRK